MILGYRVFTFVLTVCVGTGFNEQKLVSPVIFTVHGKRAGDDEKELASQGYLPRAAE